MLISKFAIDYVRNNNSNNTDWFSLFIFKAIGSVKTETIIRRRIKLNQAFNLTRTMNRLIYLSIPLLYNKLEYQFQILVW